MNVAIPFPMERAIWPFWFVNVLAFTAGGSIFYLWRMNKW